jgi:hypothetical protein
MRLEERVDELEKAAAERERSSGESPSR